MKKALVLFLFFSAVGVAQVSAQTCTPSPACCKPNPACCTAAKTTGATGSAATCSPEELKKCQTGGAKACAGTASTDTKNTTTAPAEKAVIARKED